MVLISAEKLCLGYEGRAVVRDLDFSVSQGDYLTILGENGTGKTTLVKAILRRQPGLSGRLNFGQKLRPGYLPQLSDIPADFPATAREIVRSGYAALGLRPFYTRAQKAAAREYMERTGVAGLERAPFTSLSGGQRRRVLLARALCAAEGLLVLDEPKAGLDPNAAAELTALLRSLNREDGYTIVAVSHDVAASLGDSSHILHLYAGGCFFGAREEYIASGLAKKLGGERR